MSVRASAILLLTAAIAPAADRPVGLNLAGVTDWSTELVFVDAFKTARPWISQAEGKPWGQGGPLELDDNGHVKKLAPGQAAETLLFVDQHGRYPAGDYLCLYDGTGELSFGLAAEVKDRKPNRVVVAVHPDRGHVSIKLTKTDPADPVRNIRFVLPGFENKYEKEPFHPSLLARLKGFACVRFMDWGRTNDSPVVTWADRTTPAHCTQAGKAGVAVEYQLRLANAAGVDAWLCVPHQADDGYVTELAKLVRANLAPGRKVYLEYSNETWNGQFAQARYCRQQGLKLGLSKDAYQAQLRYSSQRSVEIFKLFEAVFGNDPPLVRVLAAQSANPWTGLQVMGWQDAAKHADAIAIAPYFGHSLGSPKTADKVAAMTPEQILAEARKDLAENAKKLKTYAEQAKQRGLTLVAYESGQHLAGVAGAENNAKLTEAFHRANRHPAMAALYRDDLNQWFEAGGGLNCVFSSVGRYTKWGSWGLLEHWDQDEQSAPKMRAVRAIMAGK
jgi:hypothetical protein